MSSAPVRAVFDCMVFLQAVLSDRGPAGGCLKAVEEGRVKLLLSAAILREIEGVLSREELRSRFERLTANRVREFLDRIQSIAAMLPDPERAITLPRDTDDEPYLNLAIVGGAQYLVTWNERHLIYLMRNDTPEGREFCARFPELTVLTPPGFLDATREDRVQGQKTGEGS